ncbi:hypothetical protein BD560DRAFT_175643 [Blakeslea trispora]|nr:hypothetical protein BD560DRAFT_175643 [Blakeslea trispora]
MCLIVLISSFSLFMRNCSLRARKAKRWGKTKLAETTFIHDRLSDILDCTFGSLDADLFHYNMQDKPMSSSSFEPDYLLSLNTCNSESIDLYVMEAKAPEAHKGDMDFVKISVMMKQMMDELISRGLSVDDAVVFGTILHGNQIYQYEMTLPYSGIYLMKEVSVSVLPSAVNDIRLFVDLVPRYLKIMDHLDQVAEAIELLPVEKAIHPYQRATAFYVKEKAE